MMCIQICFQNRLLGSPEVCNDHNPLEVQNEIFILELFRFLPEDIALGVIIINSKLISLMFVILVQILP